MKRLLESSWVIWLLVLCCFPVGVFLLWKSPEGTRGGKWALSIVGGVVFVLLVGMLWSQPQMGELVLHGENLQLTPGQERLLSLQVGPAGARQDSYLRYHSTDPSVAVFEKGIVRAVGPGQVELYVTSEDGAVLSNRVALEVISFAAQQPNIIETEPTHPPEQPTETSAPVLEPTQSTLAGDQLERTVFVGKTGTKYHLQECTTLKGKGSAISLTEALAQGREPCKRCNPG